MPRSNTRFVARRSKNKQHLSNFEAVQASKLRVQSPYKNITSSPPCFLSSQFLQYLCETSTRHFVRSRRICSVYPGTRPFGLSENIFEIHLHQAALRFPCCHRRRLAFPFRCWRVPCFNFLHGELNLSRLRKTLLRSLTEVPAIENFRRLRFSSLLLFLSWVRDFVYNLILAAKKTQWN